MLVGFCSCDVWYASNHVGGFVLRTYVAFFGTMNGSQPSSKVVSHYRLVVQDQNVEL